MTPQPQVFLYIPPHLVRPGYGYSSLLYPFWGQPQKENRLFAAGQARSHNFDPTYYSLVEDPASADYVFMPYSYWSLLRKEPELIRAYVEEAKKLGKKLLVDAIGDPLGPIDLPDSIVLRYSQYRRHLKENEIIIPVYAEDLLESYEEGKLTIRSKREKALVGFAGWGSLPFFSYPRSYARFLPLLVAGLFTTRFDLYKKGVFLRQRAILILSQSKLVDTLFLTRNSFSGNIKTVQGDPVVVRREFVDNLLSSDYSLSIRGDANQGTRFFEALAMGRIPLLLDTDIVLPLEDKINYRQFCVFVDYRDLSRIDSVLSDFHKNVTPEEFESMQRRAREAFEKYLRLDAYTPYLMEMLKEKAHNADA